MILTFSQQRLADLKRLVDRALSLGMRDELVKVVADALGEDDFFTFVIRDLHAKAKAEGMKS